jgi:tetratricopeptide (TPR) repeat protein
MNEVQEKWQWIDEDPIEQLLRAPKNADRADSLAKSPVEFPEPLRSGEAPGSSFMNIDAEPEHPLTKVDPLVCPENLERSAAETVAADGRVRAADGYSAYITAEPNDSAAHFDLAVSLEKLGQWDAAASSFRRVLEIEPGHAEALIGLGACLLYLNEAEEGLNCFQQSLLSNAEKERALLGKAVALQKRGCYEEAEGAYQELLQITLDCAEPLANLIALSVARRDTAAVAEYSSRLLRLDPHSKAALQGLATQAMWNGDQATAIDYCTRLVELDPISFEAWYSLGFAQREMRPAKGCVANR